MCISFCTEPFFASKLPILKQVVALFCKGESDNVKPIGLKKHIWTDNTDILPETPRTQNYDILHGKLYQLQLECWFRITGKRFIISKSQSCLHIYSVWQVSVLWTTQPSSFIRISNKTNHRIFHIQIQESPSNIFSMIRINHSDGPKSDTCT